MKKYKTDIGTLVFIGLGALFFLGVTILAFFVINNSPLWVKITSLLFTILGALWFFDMQRYDIVIAEQSITVKIPPLYFLNNYQTIKFEEIQELYNVLTPFPENPVIFIKIANKKAIPLMIGFGLPWDALLDILEKLPKDVKISFEPELWKLIKRPFTKNKVNRVNIIAITVIFLLIVLFIYWLLKNRIIQTIRQM